MALTASKPKTFAINYGLAGGPLHARGLLRLMKAAGFELASSEKADILIAHSAGCWLIPPASKPRLVVYIGMPLSKSSLRKTFLLANRSSFRRNNFITNLQTKLKSAYYDLRQPRRNLRIIKMARLAQPLVFPKANAVFIANRHDPWPKSDTLDDYAKLYAWSFINLEGAHDDIWDHPERYVEIVKYYAGLLG